MTHFPFLVILTKHTSYQATQQSTGTGTVWESYLVCILLVPILRSLDICHSVHAISVCFIFAKLPFIVVYAVRSGQDFDRKSHSYARTLSQVY